MPDPTRQEGTRPLTALEYLSIQPVDSDCSSRGVDQAPNHVWARQGQIGEEGGQQVRQGGASVSCWTCGKCERLQPPSPAYDNTEKLSPLAATAVGPVFDTTDRWMRRV